MIKLLPALVSAFTLSFAAAAFADSHELEITGDATAGEKSFRKCKACHQVGPEAKAWVGPVLNGFLGRAAGQADGFNYSKALVERAESDEGLIWTPETLDAFLTKPKDYLKGTKMSFAGVRKEDERANIIAYLATFTE